MEGEIHSPGAIGSKFTSGNVLDTMVYTILLKDVFFHYKSTSNDKSQQLQIGNILWLFIESLYKDLHDLLLLFLLFLGGLLWQCNTSTDEL